jgi:hypothetical protein
MTRRLNHRPVSRAVRNGSATASVGANGSCQATARTETTRTPRSKTTSGDRLEETDRPLIVPIGMSVLAI